jgi:hypothetical protein
MFPAALPPRIFYENPPHCLGSRREEMTARVPALLILDIDQTDESVVHQRCGLKRLSGRFPGQPSEG